MSGAAVRRLRGVSPRRVLLLPGRLVLAVPRRVRRRLTVLAVLAAALCALYMLVLRDLGVVAVDRVEVSGLTGTDAARATAALEAAGRSGTTLHVARGAIDGAVARFPAIRSVRVQTDFPSGMRIRVIQQRPAAMLTIGNRRVPVAGDGSVLTSLPIRESLPTVAIRSGAVPERHLTAGSTLDAVRVAGGAPAALTSTLEDVTRSGAKGWVVQVRDGPLLIFGSATQLAAKWAAATRVLADRDAAGADYIDLRLPDRPAAGGLPVQTVQPLAPAGTEEGADQPGADAGQPAQGVPSAGTPAPGTGSPQPTTAAPQQPAPQAAPAGTEP